MWIVCNTVDLLHYRDTHRVHICSETVGSARHCQQNAQNQITCHKECSARQGWKISLAPTWLQYRYSSSARKYTQMRILLNFPRNASLYTFPAAPILYHPRWNFPYVAAMQWRRTRRGQKMTGPRFPSSLWRFIYILGGAAIGCRDNGARVPRGATSRTRVYVSIRGARASKRGSSELTECRMCAHVKNEEKKNSPACCRLAVRTSLRGLRTFLLTARTLLSFRHRANEFTNAAGEERPWIWLTSITPTNFAARIILFAFELHGKRRLWEKNEYTRAEKWTGIRECSV